MPILDKFYTKKDIAKYCIDCLNETINITTKDKILEPAAGNGSFSSQIPNIYAMDILPEGDNIDKQDFLIWETKYLKWITISNPPFGHRCDMALRFINKATEFSDVIAYILPVSFMKWSVQSQINNQFKLVKNIYLPFNSFFADEHDYCIRTVFQIWVRKNSEKDNNFKDLRLTKSPPTSHPDFNIWQYNATPQSIKTIENPWTIATYRQGHHDYNALFSRKDYNTIYELMTRPSKKQQFFFIEPKTAESEKIIRSMDFNSLAERNMLTPGFGKGDFVSYFMELKENNN